MCLYDRQMCAFTYEAMKMPAYNFKDKSKEIALGQAVNLAQTHYLDVYKPDNGDIDTVKFNKLIDKYFTIILAAKARHL
jgi:hypothetical protein